MSDACLSVPLNNTAIQSHLDDLTLAIDGSSSLSKFYGNAAEQTHELDEFASALEQIAQSRARSFERISRTYSLPSIKPLESSAHGKSGDFQREFRRTRAKKAHEQPRHWGQHVAPPKRALVKTTSEHKSDSQKEAEKHFIEKYMMQSSVVVDLAEKSLMLSRNY